MLGIIGLFDIGAPEIILIAIVFLVLFGSKKIPELMQGLGKGIREFKNATNDIHSDITSAVNQDKKEEKTDKA